MTATAARLGRSLSAVLNRVQRLRARGYPIPPRAKPPRAGANETAAAAEVRRLRGEGLGVAEIARRMGRPESWVAGRLAKARRDAEAAADAKARRRPKRPAKRTCNLCPTVFQPRSPYERFCETCRRTAVHAAGWSFSS